MPANPNELYLTATFFKKVKIETNYIKGSDSRSKENKSTKRQVHTIIGLSPYGKNSTNVTFEKTDVNGKVARPTIQHHFMQKYNIRLVAPQAPLVNFGTTVDPKWLPSELCKVIPGQLVRRLLDPQQTSAMIKFAARSPWANAGSITSNGLKVTMINPVVNGQNSNLSAFGIKVNPAMITVPGRILNPPILLYRGLKTTIPNNGAWNLDPRKLGERPFRVARRLGAW
jgi:hypothetical protein